MDIGNAVKIIRKKKNISQKELANLCELSTNAICSIENGATFPSKIVLQRFAKLWIYLNLIYYYSAFQKRIFLKTSGYCTKHYARQSRKI